MSDAIWSFFLLFMGLGLVTSIGDGAFWLGKSATEQHKKGLVSLVKLNRMIGISHNAGAPEKNTKRKNSLKK